MRLKIQKYLHNRKYHTASFTDWTWKHYERDAHFIYDSGPDCVEATNKSGQTIRLDHVDGVCQWTLENIGLKGLLDTFKPVFFCYLTTRPTFENVPYSGFALVGTGDDSEGLYFVNQIEQSISRVELSITGFAIASTCLKYHPSSLVDGLLPCKELCKAIGVDPVDLSVITIKKDGSNEASFFLPVNQSLGFASVLTMNLSLPQQLSFMFDELLFSYAKDRLSKTQFIEMDEKARTKLLWDGLVDSRLKSELRDRYGVIAADHKRSHPDIYKQISLLLKKNKEVEDAIENGESFVPPYYVEGHPPLKFTWLNYLKLRKSERELIKSRSSDRDATPSGVSDTPKEDEGVSYEINGEYSSLRLIDFGDSLQLDLTLKSIPCERRDQIYEMVLSRDWQKMEYLSRTLPSHRGELFESHIELFTLEVSQCVNSTQQENLKDFIRQVIPLIPEFKDKADEFNALQERAFKDQSSNKLAPGLL